uniref:RING-type E3 ubiquitin transferase n=1 Tax=Phlebotomus papatasi TaxID=29031 RepID=A0A1B0D7G4_PHLPP
MLSESFLNCFVHDEPSAIRHGGVRRIPHSGRAINGPRSRRANMHFNSSGGLSAMSPSGRESVDPIAELLSQLSGVRRAPQTSQLHQLQMQIQLERQQVSAARAHLERLPRRQAHPVISSSSATSSNGLTSSGAGASSSSQQQQSSKDCDSCLKSNFRGRRYKCLICYDYDLCANCYEENATSTRHSADHPMQCILTRTDFELYYGVQSSLRVSHVRTAKRMGLSDVALVEHVGAEHTDTGLEIVCPVCAAIPGGEPNLVTDDFAGHLTLEHRTGHRDLIAFLISFSNILQIISFSGDLLERMENSGDFSVKVSL